MSKLKQADKELVRLYEKSRELDSLKSQFYESVSHELRTPLALILGQVSRLLSHEDLDEEAKWDLVGVQRNARLLDRDVNNLLDIARLDAGRMRMEYSRIDLPSLARLVASHFDTVAADRNVDYAVKTPAALLGEVDTEKLQRVLFILLSNAFRVTPEHGTIRFYLIDRKDEAVFVLQDTGPGIPEAMREVIFERFRQFGSSSIRDSGTVLGLAIVREFVGLHRGSVNVSKTESGENCFTVRIPLAAPEGAQVKAAGAVIDQDAAAAALAELGSQVGSPPHRNASVSPGAPLILVVEDNPEMNAFLTESLGNEYSVAAAFDGQEALEKAIEHPPDLIVSDIMMPRMSGEDLMREVRNRPELDEVPILILTARADEKFRVHLLNTGAQDCLVKPFSTEELLARAGGLIARKRKSEASLRQSYALLQAVTEGVPDAIFVKDEAGCYRMINSAGAKRLGAPVNRVIGKDDAVLFDAQTAARICADDRKVMAEGQTLTFEETRTSPGGDRTYLTTKAPHRDDEGRIIGVLGISVDITDRKRAEDQLRTMNETLEQRVIERTAELEQRTIQLEVLARQLTQAEQKERRRVAYILHEHFQQLLAGAKFALTEASEPRLHAGLPAIIQKVQRILDDAIQESRSLTLELSPPILRYARMAEILRWLADSVFAKQGLQVDVRADDEVDTKDQHLRELLFQGVRELLSNVTRHAGVNQAVVEMAWAGGGQVRIAISDQGVGFDVQKYHSEVLAGQKFGLFNIQERLELIGGHVGIDSAPGRGTRVILLGPAQGEGAVGHWPAKER